MKKDNIKKSLLLAGGVTMPLLSSAAETAGQADTCFSNPLFNTLLLVIIILVIMIVALSGALKNLISSGLFNKKTEKTENQNGSGPAKAMGTALFFLLLNLQTHAQEKAPAGAADGSIGGLDPFTFYTMLVTIAVELLVLGVVFNTFKNLLGQNNAKALQPVAETKPKGKTMLEKLNDTVEMDREESILLEHDYDGIRELDNNLPPWWKYGFYLTILVSVIYLVNYHITKTAPLQAEEYAISIKKAEAEIAEYMKSSANNVDENTVKLLTEPSDLAAGRDLFIANCSACHGKAGEGTVGPNLTDEYWLHSGGVRDIFKTIKYGWPDKGMKSWKDDFSPMQIAQLTSFIRSLKGSNPPKPKEKQGELYAENAAPADSAAMPADTAKVLSLPASLSKQ